MIWQAEGCCQVSSLVFSSFSPGGNRFYGVEFLLGTQDPVQLCIDIINIVVSLFDRFIQGG